MTILSYWKHYPTSNIIRDHIKLGPLHLSLFSITNERFKSECKKVWSFQRLKLYFTQSKFIISFSFQYYQRTGQVKVQKVWSFQRLKLYFTRSKFSLTFLVSVLPTSRSSKSVKSSFRSKKLNFTRFSITNERVTSDRPPDLPGKTAARNLLRRLKNFTQY